MMINYQKTLSFVLIAAILGGFNILYSLHDLSYILQEVIFFVPLFSVVIWIGIIMCDDLTFHYSKSESFLLKGIIISTCLLLLWNILLNLIGLKFLDFSEMEGLRLIGTEESIKESRRYGYREFREFIDLQLWNYLSLALLIFSLIVIWVRFKWKW